LLPAEAEPQLEIAVLQERLADALAGDAGSMEDMESRLRDFAARYAGSLAAATDETVGGFFALVEPVHRDLLRADADGTLNESDRAAARGFIGALDSYAAREINAVGRL